MSGFATPPAKDVNGPGNRLAALTSEYGIIRIGFVGNAKNGCGGAINVGVLDLS